MIYTVEKDGKTVAVFTQKGHALNYAHAGCAVRQWESETFSRVIHEVVETTPPGPEAEPEAEPKKRGRAKK
jgi:hypothetical protein